MKKLILALLIILSSTAAYADCSFNFSGDSDHCSNDSGSYYSDEPSYNQDLSCMCQETSPSTTSTQWVPNPSGSGGNYETVTTPGFTRSVPCACN